MFSSTNTAPRLSEAVLLECARFCVILLRCAEPSSSPCSSSGCASSSRPRRSTSSSRGCFRRRDSSSWRSRTPTGAASVRCCRTPDMDYDAGVVARRPVDRLHVGARRVGRSLSRQTGRQRARAADRRSGVRRSGGVLSGRQAAGVRDDARRRHGGPVDDGSADAAREAADIGRRRRLPAVVVAGRPMDRVLVRSRQRDCRSRTAAGSVCTSSTSTSIHPDGTG